MDKGFDKGWVARWKETIDLLRELYTGCIPKAGQTVVLKGWRLQKDATAKQQNIY